GFGPADDVDGFKAVVGEQQGIWIGVADVFGREYKQSTRDEGWVFAAFDHAGEPIDRCVGVASADGFDEGGDDIVVLFAGFIIEGHILLHLLKYKRVGDGLFLRMGGVHDELKHVEQFAGVSAGKAKQGFVFFDLYGMFLKIAVPGDGLFEDSGEFLLGEVFQYVYLTPRKQRGDDFEGGVFGG